MEELEQRVRNIIAGQVRRAPEDVRDEMSLTEDLGADSLDRTEILLSLETEFGVSLSEPEAGAVRVRDVIDWVSSVVAVAPAAFGSAVAVGD